VVTLTSGVTVTWPVGSAPKGYCLGCLDARADSGAGQLFCHGVLVKTHPRLLWEDRCLSGPPRRDLGPSRQRDQQDCIAAALDALLIPAGQVGTIMAVFVPNSGYKCSKNP
jgi:hypothetical protein